MKNKQRKQLVYLGIVIALILSAFYVGQSMAKSSDNVPGYLKTGAVTLVFTQPKAVDNINADCLSSAKVFITSTLWGTLKCEGSESKYIPGEIDCACQV